VRTFGGPKSFGWKVVMYLPNWCTGCNSW